MVVFKSKVFYWVLVVGVSMLLLMNFFILINTGRYISLLPIIVQTILLILLLIKHRYTKIFLQIWLIVFFVLASFLQIAGKLLKSVGDNIVNWYEMYPIVVQMCIGIIVFILLQRNVQSLPKS